MMEADRIRAARQRLWRAWIFGGLVWSIFFLGIAFAVTWAAGVQRSEGFSTVMLGAMVLALGAYGILYIGAIGLHIFKRLWKREPVMEIED